jgi:hypothetical protein
MNDIQIAKIKQFLGDKDMQGVIKGLLRDKFLERKNTDVHYLAAQTLAVQFLEDAWVEMDRYRLNESKSKQTGQIGL